MTVNELIIKLVNIGIPQDLYGFTYSSSLDNHYCLIKKEKYWEVFYVERGEKKLIVEFEYEFQACDYLYGIMLRIKESN